MSLIKNLHSLYDSPLIGKISDICKVLKSYFGIEYVTYSHISRSGQIFHISNTMEKSLKYWGDGEYASNPFYVRPYSFEAGAYPMNEVANISYQNNLKELETEGLAFKLLINRNERGNIHQFILGSSIKELPIVTIYMNNRKKIDSFIDHYIKCSEKFDQERYFISLPEILGGNFSFSGLGISSSLFDANELNYFREIGIDLPQLTARELECCSQVVKGLTAKEIAAHLHLSARTVEKHIDIAKQKFSVTKKSELINQLLKFM